MRANKIFFFLVCCLPFFAQAQNAALLDSLKNVAAKGNSREKFKALSVLADRYSDNDLNKSMYYAKQSLLVARKVKNDTFMALACNSVANVFQYKSELDSALAFHRKALAHRENIKDSIGIADTYNNIGIAFDQRAQFGEALRNYFRALAFYDKKAAADKQAMTFTNIGIVYKEQKEYGKALQYYRKAYDAYQQTNDDFGKTVSAGNLGSVLLNFGNYNGAIKFSNIAKEGYRKLDAVRYVAYPISTIASVYDSLHDFEKANENYLEAIRLHEINKNGFEVAENANSFANCLIKQKKYAESIAMSKKALEFAKQADAGLLQITAFRNLSKAHAKVGNYNEAYLFSNLYNTGKDSIFEKDKTRAVFEMETKYETEKKERQLLQKDVEAAQKNYLLLAVSVLALFLALTGFLIYRQQKIKNRQQEQEFQLKSAIAQIETQNQLQEQRLSISRDLHDNIGAQLTFIISSVDNIKYAFEVENPKLDNKLRNISDFAKSTIVELRDTIWAMNSSEITFADLRARLLNFIEKAKEADESIQFKFVIDESLDDVKLTSISGMNIYRTIQEAIHNAIKYAEASEIAIAVHQKADKIEISIGDNGIGFDLATIEKGNGLVNMEKRIEDIGGVFSVSATYKKGTTVSLLLNHTI